MPLRISQEWLDSFLALGARINGTSPKSGCQRSGQCQGHLAGLLCAPWQGGVHMQASG